MEAPVHTLEVRRVPSSADLMQAGDYCYIEKRAPIRKFEPVADEAPRGFIRKLISYLGGKKQSFKEVIEIVWPDYDAIVLMCPHCNQPIGTTKEHHIVSTDPLTIKQPLACAYSRPTPTASPLIAFRINDGKVTPLWNR